MYYDILKIHGLLIDFYLHYILIDNKEIATHYNEWKNQFYDEKMYPFDQNGTYLSLYLGVIRLLKFDTLYYTKNAYLQTVLQTQYIESHHDTYICYHFDENDSEIARAKQFMKSIF